VVLVWYVLVVAIVVVVVLLLLLVLLPEGLALCTLLLQPVRELCVALLCRRDTRAQRRRALLEAAALCLPVCLLCRGVGAEAPPLGLGLGESLQQRRLALVRRLQHGPSLLVQLRLQTSGELRRAWLGLGLGLG